MLSLYLFRLIITFFCTLFLLEPVFVKIQKIPDSTEKNDDKLYFFFREKSLDAAGGSTPSVLARVGRVCLVRTWTKKLLRHLILILIYNVIDLILSYINLRSLKKKKSKTLFFYFKLHV